MSVFTVIFVRHDAPLLIAVVWLLTPCCLVGGYKYLNKIPCLLFHMHIHKRNFKVKIAGLYFVLGFCRRKPYRNLLRY